MFEHAEFPRVFGLAPGVDFPKALVQGLVERSKDKPPEEMARVQVIVNTARMARRIRALFDDGPSLLLPSIQLVTDLAFANGIMEVLQAISPLRRRLELVQLISALLKQQPDLAPRSSLFDLADSLATLMDEMQSEGVSPDKIISLDVSDESGHWKRAQSFLAIVQRYFGDTSDTPGGNERQMMITLRLIDHWNSHPPTHPIILAGSTGSRGATYLLMQAIAKLPQGAIVFPGYDFDMPDHVWAALDNSLTSEDHPQYRFQKLMRALDIKPDKVQVWNNDPIPCPERNRVVSLALRPAPVTDQWLSEGPNLGNLAKAMENVTLLEAPTVRDEAMAIAMRLRKSAEDGQISALITPDRMLTRQVTAALERWKIVPDDSAGSPLQLSPPGRFMRHIANLFQRKLTAEALITLLKHPLTHQGCDRGNHHLHTQNLELYIRKNGPPFPTKQSLENWATEQNNLDAPKWTKWVIDCFVDQDDSLEIPLTTRIAEHVKLAEKISSGIDAQTQGTIWLRKSGQQARKIVDDLQIQAPYGGDLTAFDYGVLFSSVLASAEGVRDRDAPHSQILIWGTMEARVQGADLLILAGLNEGIWPQSPSPDPWLNRKLRNDAGLLLPERKIGLSAHDFQQAIGANEVWLTRSIRSDDAETVTSRWLNRLINMLGGLPKEGGVRALETMVGKGKIWLDLAKILQDPGKIEAAPRPSPRPPVKSRPRHLSVTEIKRLIRDPYSIYAKHILRLKPLNTLMQDPDALLRGITIHKIFELFVKSVKSDDQLNTRVNLLHITDTVLAENVPWAQIRSLWKARIERIADWFIATEKQRLKVATPTEFEIRGEITIPDLNFRLTAAADRIDQDLSGAVHIYDYKSGSIPTVAEQLIFDKQLLLEAVIASQGGFKNLAPAPVARARFVGLGSNGKESDAPLDKEPPEKVWSDFKILIGAYLKQEQGFTARRVMFKKGELGVYDQLSRFGEWDITEAPNAEDLE